MRSTANSIQESIGLLIYGIVANPYLYLIQLIRNLLESFVSICTVILPKILLEKISLGDYRGILEVIALYCGALIVLSFYKNISIPYIAVENEKLNAKMIDTVLKKSINLRLEYFEQKDAYNQYSLVLDNCCKMLHATLDQSQLFISSLINILMMLSLLRWLDWKLLMLMLTVISVQILLTTKQKKTKYLYVKEITKQNRKINYLYRLFFNPQFLRDVKTNSAESLIFEKKKTATNAILKETLKSNKKISIDSFLLDMLKVVETFILYPYFSLVTIKKVIGVGDFIVSINAYTSLKSGISNIFTVFVSAYENRLYISDYYKFLQLDFEEATEGTRKFLPEEFDCLEFKNVSFKYPNSTQFALYKVSFSIHKGERVSIVGKNGSGKTTLVKLMLRMYTPNDGCILLNGHRLEEYDVASIRKAFCVLFQDFALYAFDIRENITFDSSETFSKSDENVWSALGFVNLSSKIYNLPQKLKTPITSQFMDSGIEFSGGERQRIALARILYKNGPVVILDEPTSNLDVISEEKIYKFFTEASGKTVFVISHKLNYSRMFDKIILMNSGQIIEYGNHQQLIDKNGEYAALYRMATKQFE